MSEIEYAYNGDTAIAYQVGGHGPVDLVYVPTWISNLDVFSEEPTVARFFERLGSFARVIGFDRRGCGLSDGGKGWLVLEEQMDDVIAVMDAAGCEKAAVMGQLEGGAMSMLFAATHPERVSALILYAAFAKTTYAEGYEFAPTEEERAAFLPPLFADWGSGRRFGGLAPSLADDPSLRRWFGKLERGSAPPGAMRALLQSMAAMDLRPLLPSIRVPTLIMRRRDDQFLHRGHFQYLVDHIDGARAVELPGADNLIVAGDTSAITDEVEEFLTGARHQPEPDRVLATVLFTDIVDGTKRAAELGDRRWRDLLERHYEIVRRQLDRHQGKEIKTMGDGFLATFDGPARAIRCAVAATESMRPLGIDIRAGVHTGELEVMGDDVGGMAVNIGARVGAKAGAGEVLVSGTVKDLVVGSGFDFAERGSHELKGVPGEWRLFAVA